jgi:hypothetical protein
LFFAILIRLQHLRQERQRRVARALALQKQHEAYLRARQRLALWVTQQALPDDPQGLAQIEQTFHLLLQSLLNTPTRGLTHAEIAHKLIQDRIGQRLHHDLQALLHTCDIARFAPWPSPDAPSTILRHLSALLPQLPEMPPHASY